MHNDARKAATRAFKEQKTEAGIYAVSCPAAGAVWIGQTPRLDAIRNRLWFSLGSGGGANHAMQAAWTSHGAESFEFEVLETIREESALAQKDRLAKRLDHWLAARGAAPV